MACRKKEFSRLWLSEHSTEVLHRLEKTGQFRKADCIAIYHSIPGEVETASFIEKWADKKTFLLPVVEGNNIILYPYLGNHTLCTGNFGIREPDRTACSPWDKTVDLLVVPGVAFDRQGNRLGRGKGYYDRLLTTLTATKIGICFDFQLHNQIPAEPFDITMDLIISESEILKDLPSSI